MGRDLKAMLKKNAEQVRHEKNEVVKKEKAEKVKEILDKTKLDMLN